MIKYLTPEEIAEVIISWFDQQDSDIQDALMPFIHWETIYEYGEFDDAYEHVISDALDEVPLRLIKGQGEEE